MDRVTSWDIGDTLQPVKASKVVTIQQGLALTHSDSPSRGPEEKIQQLPVAEPSRQLRSSDHGSRVEIGCHGLARTGSSVEAGSMEFTRSTSLLPDSLAMASQLEDETSLHSKRNAGSQGLCDRAETTRHTPVLTT